MLACNIYPYTHRTSIPSAAVKPFTSSRLPPRRLTSCKAVQHEAEILAANTQLALYSIADAAAATDPATPQRAGGFVAPLADALETVLKFLQSGLDTYHVPYSYGFSIILLTLLVKTATFPLTKQQVESSLQVQTLKPRIDLIKARYGDDKEKIQKETSLLYEQAGVNPLAGCLPSIATIPIFIGLYNSLTNVANEGLLESQGFLWVPSLAGPTTLAARQSGLGTAWLFPFVDGHPPIGWHDAICYLSVPALLVIVQYISSSIIAPPINPDDPNAKTSKALIAFLPLMVGYFALNVPSGLSLYYLSNTVLTSAIQIYLRKLGGADVKINDLGPVTKPGSGRRMGVEAIDFEPWTPPVFAVASEVETDALEAEEEEYANTISAQVQVVQEQPKLDPATVNRKCKRVRLSTLAQNA